MRFLASSIVSFLRPTSLLGRSNLLECNSGNHLISATGREIDLLDFLTNFLLYLLRCQGLPSPASYTADRSLPNKLQMLLLQAPFIGRFPHETTPPSFSADFFLRTSWAILASGTRHDSNWLWRSTRRECASLHFLASQASSNSALYQRHIGEPSHNNNPLYGHRGERTGLTISIHTILVDRDKKTVVE
jgi:hypothetical protein